MSDYTKAPRIFVEHALAESDSFCFEDKVHHYLKNVMRVKDGAPVRLFNGRDGEYLGQIEHAGKKDMCVTVIKRLFPQKAAPRKLHLLFSPIKKERMDFLIEKAVELNVTDIHPVLTLHSDIRKLNSDRMRLQIIEAAEQCERLDIPTLHPAEDMFKKLGAWNASVSMLAALERFDAKPIHECACDTECGILIGPSGGFSEDEKQKLAKLAYVTPVSLGKNILRAETAAIAALSVIALS